MRTFSSSLAIAICATAVAVAADMKTTYTGCVESVNHGAAFLLTHVSDGGMAAMHRDMAMKHDAMMEKPGADSMDHDGMQMTPTAVFLSGRSDLRKHVGQKVAVSGTLSNEAPGSMRDDLRTLAVNSLKVVAKACSQDGQ